MREIPAADRLSESDSAAASSVSEGVDVGDSSGQGRRRRVQQRRRCHVRSRRQKRRCYVCGRQRVVGGSKGVDGVLYTAAMAEAVARVSAASSIQQRWRP